MGHEYSCGRFWRSNASWELHAYTCFCVGVNNKQVHGRVKLSSGDVITVPIKHGDRVVGLWPKDIRSSASMRCGLRPTGPAWVFRANADYDAARCRLLAASTGLDLRTLELAASADSPPHKLRRLPLADVLNTAEQL